MFGLIDAIIRPVGQRVGTLVGSFLTSQGIAADDVSIIAAAIPVVIGVCFDLVQRSLY
jgi:hypothetical protein